MKGCFGIFSGEIDKVLFLTVKVVAKLWFREFPGLHFGEFCGFLIVYEN